ncbi:hypothetical protein SAMN05421747_11512 [Parapedobacter composti]|uniref:VOC domain-containing protein n=1 Tax=Parapedobacter composti TaxID=623281 RepID=A0A1I1KIC6_9SPHI|nr:VOC family protein [Parapedobacter composti]SFC57170.1 hypothetical protein SAMN05421747_11512 [Parapedobacter composti]
MHIRLGRTIILVADYDEAFEFYRQNFFCEKLFDAVMPDGERYLHVRFQGDEQNGIWFLRADTAQKALLGNQTGGQPTLVLYTDECQKVYEHVLNNGVTILEPIKDAEGSRFFHCADLYGNRITVVQLTG